MADVKPPVMNHVGRCYAKVADGIANIANGDIILICVLRH